jgi:hypothetical protein
VASPPRVYPNMSAALDLTLYARATTPSGPVLRDLTDDERTRAAGQEEAVAATATALTLDDAPQIRRVTANMADPDFLTTAPTGLPGGSSWTDGEQGLAAVLDIAGALSADLNNKPSTDAEMMRWEQEHASKFQHQRGALFGWWIPELPYVVDRPSSMSDAIALIFEFAKKVDVSRAADELGGYRRHTNHAGATQRNSDVDLLLRAMIATWAGQKPGQAVRRLEEAHATLADIFGGPRQPFVTLFSRTGPAGHKEMRLADMIGGVISARFIAQGVAPRRRHVKGPPAEYNIFMRPGYARLRLLIAALGLWPGTESELARVFHKAEKAGWKPFEDDVSGWDDAVSSGDIDDAANGAAAAWPDLADVWAVWRAGEALPVLTGPRTAAEDGCLLKVKGTISSGLLFTSAMDTILNFARCLKLLAKLWRRSVAAVLDLHLMLWRQFGIRLISVWGDDTMIWLPPDMPAFTEEEWAAASLALGFKSKPRHGGRAFLQRWFKGGRYHGSLARFWQQTAMNEKKGRCPAIELLGVTARGQQTADNPLWPRWERRLFDPALSSTLRDYHVSDLATAQQALRSDKFAEELKAYLKQTPEALADWQFIGRMSDVARFSLAIAEEVAGTSILRQEAAPHLLSYTAAITLAHIREMATAMAQEDERYAIEVTAPEQVKEAYTALREAA